MDGVCSTSVVWDGQPIAAGQLKAASMEVEVSLQVQAPLKLLSSVAHMRANVVCAQA